MKIRLESSDWLSNAGLTGIVNILEFANLPYVINHNYLEIDSNILEEFESIYFQYFENRYFPHLSYYTITHKALSFIGLDKWNIDTLDDWNKYVELTKKLLKSNSYKAAYTLASSQTNQAERIEKRLSKINVKDDQDISSVQTKIDESKENLSELLLFLQQPEVKKYIIAKNIIYSIIDNFWDGVSFLHKSAPKKDMFDEFRSYFIEPVLQYLQTDHKKDKYCCMSCSRPIQKLSKPSSFGLAWLKKMGADMTRKTSHFWNLQSNTAYICPLCHLVFSCIPAGFTVINSQGYFVNCSSTLRKLIKLNNNEEKMSLQENTSIQFAEFRTYFQLIRFMDEQKLKQSEKEIDNIQIINFNARTDEDRKHPYTFNVLSKDKLKVIQRNKKSLSSFVDKTVKLKNGDYINVFLSVVDRLYKNRNQFDLIATLCKNGLPSKGEEALRGAGFISDLIHFNNQFLWTIYKTKEDESMSGYSSYVKRDVVEQMKTAGINLATAYKEKNATNKLSGITYRMLNSLKTKNASRFMDTFINAHIYCGVDLPTEITEAMLDENKLQTMGYAFVVGLRKFNLSKKEMEVVIHG